MKSNKTSNRKITKASKRRLLTVGTLSIVLFAFFCFNVISYSYKIISLTNEEKDLNVKLDDLKTERENLLVEIDKLQDPDYLARYARETYYYTKNGEYVLKTDEAKKNLESKSNEIDKTNDKIEEIKSVVNKYKFVIGGSVAFLFVLIIFVIKKSHS